MRESDLNQMLVQSVKSKDGWAYKIPDPPQSVALMSNERPFDWFAVYGGDNYYVESKLLKSEFNAFSFASIRPHQLDSLQAIKHNSPESHCLLAVGYWLPHKLYEVAFFDILLIERRMNNGDRSIKKKELLEYRKTGRFLKVKKKQLDASLIKESIIYE